MIVLETGHCLQGCKQPYLSIRFNETFGKTIIGCGGPYGEGRAISPAALRTVQAAKEARLPIRTTMGLATLKMRIQGEVALSIANGDVDRGDGERFLDEMYRG